jgi:hypothetical protein
MPSWVWVVAAAAVGFVLWVAFARRWVHAWVYSWRQAAHAYAEVAAEFPVVDGPELIAGLRLGERYGSMILAEERGLRAVQASTTFLPAPLHHEPGWRERTMAELAPEALSEEVARAEEDAPEGSYFLAELDDSGLGGSSSLAPPGPAQASHGGDDQGWDVPVCATDSGPAPGADLTGSLSPHHPEEDPGPVAHAGPGLTRLADTGDIRDAALLATVTAELHRQDDDTAEYLSRLRSELLRFRLDLTASLT